MKHTVFALALVLGASTAGATDLVAVYEMASQNDPQLRSARATRDATFENEPIARSQLLPQLTVGGDLNYVYQDVSDAPNPPSSFSDDFTASSAAVQLVQPLYRKDRRVQLDQARDQVARAEVDYRLAEQELIVRVTQAYFGVLSAQNTLEASEANMKAIARQLDQAKQRFEVGLIAITDVNEAQARFDQSRAETIIARNNLDDAIESLIEITGQPTGPLADLKPGIELAPPQPASLDEWTAIALENNPGIISARYAADIARKQIQLQEAGSQPSVDLVGSYGLARSNADFGSDVDTATVGVQLVLPLYTGGRVTSSTRQARFQYEAAQEILEQQRRAVQTQVRNGYRGVLASISRVQALEAAEVSARSALEATEAGFEVGTRTLVDVLNSQRDLFAARRDLADSRYDYVLNMLSLLQASGMLSEADVQRANASLE
jgi:outer membrane protein